MAVGRTGVFLVGGGLSNPGTAITVVFILYTFRPATRLNDALKLRLPEEVYSLGRPMLIRVGLEFDEGLRRVRSIRFKGIPDTEAHEEYDEQSDVYVD